MMMKAVRIHGYGGVDVLSYENVERPQIADDDVLIRVHAAGVNPLDWKIREGLMRGMIEHALPFIPGCDLSGVIEETGAQVTNFKPGDEVYSHSDITRNGAYAEYIAVRAAEVARKPKSINHVHAAAVPFAGITAWQSLFDIAGLLAPRRILIHAAAGGVGSFATQLAAWQGAYVIGTASARNLNFVRELGAHEVIDYNTTRFEEVVKDVDVVFDTVGGETQERSWGVLIKGGILVSIISPPSEKKAAQYGVKSAYLSVQPRAAELDDLAELIDSGLLNPVVSVVLPLSEARHAQEISQSGHARGKIVLQVRD